MKTLILILVGGLIGAALGGYLSFNFVVNFAFDSSAKSFKQAVDQSYTGNVNITPKTQELLDQQKAKIQQELDKKKEELKENIKQEINNYVSQKMDELFGKKTN